MKSQQDNMQLSSKLTVAPLRGVDASEKAQSVPATKIHLISNTHCDKEYVFSGPRTRTIVLRMLDELLRIFEQVPEYKYFHLDGQTSPLETYLSLRPHRKRDIEEAICDDKLQVGPWHTLPDMAQISGESIIRNLLKGHRVAKEFGKVMKVGYNIFGFGQISQLPQIYRGFGIDNVLFYRGINEQVCPDLEFIWRSPDGSDVLGIRYPEGYRLNFVHFVYLPAVFGRSHWGCERYNWKESNGVLFHLCDNYSQDPNSFLFKTKLGLDQKAVGQGIDKLLKTFEGHTASTNLLASMGWDDGMPYAQLPDITKIANKYLGDRAELVQSSLPQYVETLRNNLDSKKLRILTGEMRHENKLVDGGETRPPLFAGVLSARVPINLANSDIELKLEKWAEPVSVFAWMCGREYLGNAFDEAWNHLFTNHSHDCIGGTHTDAVYNSIMERYSQVSEIAETETYHSLQHICEQIDTSHLDENDSALIVFNSLPYERSEVIHVHLDTPQEEHYKSIVIVDENGEESQLQVNYDIDEILYLHQKYDYPLKMDSKRFDFSFEAKQIPAFGYKVFHVHSSKGVKRNNGSQIVDQNTMQNKYLKVQINKNGTLNVTHLATGRTYRELMYFENRGEVGGPCLGTPTKLDKVITTLGASAQVSLIKDGPLVTTFQIDMDLKLPAKAVVDQGIYPFPKHSSFVTPWQRSEEVVSYPVSIFVTLHKNARYVDISIKVNNTAQDHRLRVMIPTSMSTDTIDAEGQFDVISRKIRNEDSSRYFEDIYHTQPHRYFLDVSQNEEGIALITKGTHEYEFLNYENRTIAVTLLRCIRNGPEWRVDPHEKLAQCPGEHDFSFALYPHQGNWQQADVYKQTYCHHVPLRAAQLRRNNGILPQKLSFLKLEPTELVLSTVKLSEDGNSIIIRVHNPGSSVVDARLGAFMKISKARQVNLEEEPEVELPVDGKNRVQFSVKPSQIFTLELIRKENVSFIGRVV